MGAEKDGGKDIRKAREDLQRIIDLCRSIELKGLDPYLVEVDDLIKVIKDHFPAWRKPEDLCLDTEALNHIASVVRMQGEWVKRRATTLYRDPFMIEEKIRSLPIDRLVEIFLEAWRPIVELEQLTLKGFNEALKYWGDLPPISERWQKTGYTKVDTKPVTKEEVIREGLLSSEPFIAELEKMWLELKDAASKDGRVNYWDFITSDTYEKTARRAYLASFLITYGYARLEIHPLEEKIFISPNEEPTQLKESEFISFPITISFEEWKRWREKRGA